MLIRYSEMVAKPILSLQTGGVLCNIDHPVINPNNLTIIAFALRGNTLDFHPAYIRVIDIREYFPSQGFLVNDSSEILRLDDIISQRNIYDLGFGIMNILVVDTNGKKIGRVTDCTVEIDSYAIVQLTVKSRGLGAFIQPERLVHRSQIAEIKDDSIVINSQEEVKQMPESDFIPTRQINNPFRNVSPDGEPASSTTTSPDDAKSRPPLF